MTRDPTPSPQRLGLVFGLCAYAWWGFLPLYMHLLSAAGAIEIVAHRIMWSLALLLVVLACLRRLGAWSAIFRQPRLLAMLLVSALLICANWLIYIWAVLNAHVVAASLGYFINPLVTVLMGVALLGERLRRLQACAIALAAIGVLLLAIAGGGGLIVALTLAASFAGYGLVRKLAVVPALEGLAIETALLAPFALGYLLWLAHGGHAAFGRSAGVDALLVATGVITSTPLLLFAAAARRLPLATLGILQYVSPTIQFLCGILVLGESITHAQIVTFACIWAGLAVYMVDGIRHARRPMLPG